PLSPLPLANLRALWIKSSRNCSSSLSARATPMMEKSSGRNLPRRKLCSAGNSRRLVRSPSAPKITKTHEGAGFARSVMSLGGLDLDVAAEPVAHGGQQLVGKAFLLAGAEARIERSRQNVGRHRLLDRRHDGPATLARIV